MTDQSIPSARTGDALPFCYGMAADGTFYSLDAQAGRAAVMVLISDKTACDAAATVAVLLARAAAFADRNVDIIVTGNEDVVRPLAGRFPVPCPTRLIDSGNDFLDRCGIKPGAAALLVVDRNARVAMRQCLARELDTAAILDCLDRLPSETPRDIFVPAPVIMPPNLLSARLCGELIAWFESRQSMEGEIAGIDSNGLPHSRVDRAKKSRRDMPVEPSDPYYPLLRDTLLRRCAPEMARAFQAKITRIDRLLVARYDDTGGWFRRHRDNVGENVAFREFAISVNLNTNDYDGGHLIFPEYNDHRYRPPTGAGVIFSASLLHEATPVTRGSRYVLLTFFHGEAAEKRRLAYIARSLARAETTHAGM